MEWDFSHTVTIDSLRFILKGWEDTHNVIAIIQSYNQKTKQLAYSIDFHLPNEWDGGLLPADYGKETEFIEQRNDIAKKFNNNNLTKDELYEIIFVKFESLLDDRVYQKWKKDYILKRDMDKYNL